MVDGVERMALLDLLGAGDGALHELVIDRLLHQHAARAGADLALVEREHREAFERLVEEVVVRFGDVGEEDVRRLAAELQRHRDELSEAYCMIMRPVVVSPVKAILAMRLFCASGLPASMPKPLTTLMTPGGRMSAISSITHEDAERRLLGRLEHHAIAGRKRRGELPCRHQEREVPGDDLADDAERLVIMIGDGVVVDLGEAAFLGAHDAGEIAPMVDHQRHVGMRRLADRLAVVERLDQRQQVEIGFELVGDLVQDARAFLHGGLAPGVLGLVRGVERQFDVGGGGAGHRAELLAGDRARIVEVACLRRERPICRR